MISVFSSAPGNSRTFSYEYRIFGTDNEIVWSEKERQNFSFLTFIFGQFFFAENEAEHSWFSSVFGLMKNHHFLFSIHRICFVCSMKKKELFLYEVGLWNSVQHQCLDKLVSNSFWFCPFDLRSTLTTYFNEFFDPSWIFFS